MRGEVIGAGADQHDVGRLLHHRAGERDRMARALHIGNRAGPHGLAIHDRRIELVGAIRRKNRATAGVEERIIFEELDGGFDSIERRATLIEHVGSGGERLLDPGAIVSLGFGGHRGARNHSGAAVKHQGPLVLCGSGLRGGRGSTLGQGGGKEEGADKSNGGV